jgi:hypothetical protein
MIRAGLAGLLLGALIGFAGGMQFAINAMAERYMAPAAISLSCDADAMPEATPWIDANNTDEEEVE